MLNIAYIYETLTYIYGSKQIILIGWHNFLMWKYYFSVYSYRSSLEVHDINQAVYKIITFFLLNVFYKKDLLILKWKFRIKTTFNMVK